MIMKSTAVRHLFLSVPLQGLLAASMLAIPAHAGEVEMDVIEEASGAEATVKPDGVVRIGWARDDVKVRIDGMDFPPAAGLGSWAAFKSAPEGVVAMGDTVVFQDEVDAAMDAAFANGLGVTALHNHFFYDEPKVYFMHIGGHGKAADLAAGVKAVWDAIKQVRRERPEPATRFEGPAVKPGGELDAAQIEAITGLEPAAKPGDVLKISKGRTGKMHGTEVAGTMGLGSWAAFSGSDELAAMDGDFIMTANEVQPVLKSLRDSGIHVVALHNHMIGEEPSFYFTHFWGTGSVKDLAQAFRDALDAQKAAR